MINLIEFEIEYSSVFYEVLVELANMYNKIPKFMIEILAEEKGIPHTQLDLLIWKFQKAGVLVILKNEGYYFAFRDL